MESFIDRLRVEYTNEHVFTSYGHAREIIEEWRTDYNSQRPHSALAGSTLPRPTTVDCRQTPGEGPFAPPVLSHFNDT